MKTLKEYIIEGILDIEDNIENLSVESLIEDFIKENYDVGKKLQIKKERDKYIVSTEGTVLVKNKNIAELTNGLFEWGVVGGSFYCDICESLKSLEGAPKEVKWSFYCRNCTSLESLEGAPKKVGRVFSCINCISLKSLKYAPKEVGWNFFCVGCKSLKDLKGAPKEVEVDFYCSDCGKKFTEEDVRSVCDVGGEIYI